MADLSTVNYGWVKPSVGADADSWGGVLNGDLDGIDGVVGNMASIIEVAGTELINLSGSVTGISSSVTGVSSSLGGAGVTIAGVSTSLGQVSASLGAANASIGGLSGSLAGVSASLGGASSSLAGVSTSLGGVSASLGNVSASLGGVSSSLAGVSTSLGSGVSGTNAGSLGFLGIPLAQKSGAYTPVLADAGQHFFFTANATATIPANASVAFGLGTFLKFSADVGVSLTVAIASDTLRYPTSGATGARSVSGPGFLIAEKQKSGEWWVVGGVNVA
jgi:ABC-type transporter Mla subunit MlaD